MSYHRRTEMPHIPPKGGTANGTQIVGSGIVLSWEAKGSAYGFACKCNSRVSPSATAVAISTTPS